MFKQLSKYFSPIFFTNAARYVDRTVAIRKSEIECEFGVVQRFDGENHFVIKVFQLAIADRILHYTVCDKIDRIRRVMNDEIYVRLVSREEILMLSRALEAGTMTELTASKEDNIARLNSEIERYFTTEFNDGYKWTRIEKWIDLRGFNNHIAVIRNDCVTRNKHTIDNFNPVFVHRCTDGFIMDYIVVAGGVHSTSYISTRIFSLEEEHGHSLVMRSISEDEAVKLSVDIDRGAALISYHTKESSLSIVREYIDMIHTHSSA